IDHSSVIDNFEGEFAFLSNFYVAKPFLWDGDLWPSAEHAFQAAKATDPEARRLIGNARTPGMAKRHGRRIAMRPDWEQVKVFIMREVVAAKFQAEGLGYRLAETWRSRLVEGNTWHDTTWGVCYCPQHGG